MSFDILNLVLVLVGIYGLVGFFQAEKGRGKLIGAAAVVAALGALYYRWTVTPDPVHILPQVFQQFNPFYVVALTPLSVALFSSLARKGKEPSAPRQDRNGHDHRRRGLPDPHRRVDGPHVARRGQGRRCQRYLRVAELADLDLPRADVRRAAPLADGYFVRLEGGASQVQGHDDGCWFAATAVGNYATSLIGYLWGSGMALWMVWSVLIVLCLLSALFIFSIMKKLENATAA